jgi:CheY-like chemotaxis protein
MFLDEMNKIKKIKGIEILYAEDDLILQNEMIKFMKKLELNITPVSNGKELQKFLEKQKYNLIITDLIMPQCNSLDVIESIKLQNPEQEFIVVSAYNDEKVVKKLQELGVKHILNKPFSFPALLNAMLSILE